MIDWEKRFWSLFKMAGLDIREEWVAKHITQVVEEEE
tara:strand:- start:145 stop:255 length:111 start_codon:yes stop_codon:yes gene_type:complete